MIRTPLLLALPLGTSATGIVLAAVSYDAGIINENFFAILVLTAIVTSMAAGSWTPTLARASAALRCLRSCHLLKAKMPTTTTPPAPTKPICNSLIDIAVPCLLRQAATVSARRSASSMSTSTTRDTPCSCIVTPTSCCAISMVILLWLMKMNWVCDDMRLTIWQ